MRESNVVIHNLGCFFFYLDKSIKMTRKYCHFSVFENEQQQRQVRDSMRPMVESWRRVFFFVAAFADAAVIVVAFFCSIFVTVVVSCRLVFFFLSLFASRIWGRTKVNITNKKLMKRTKHTHTRKLTHNIVSSSSSSSSSSSFVHGRREGVWRWTPPESKCIFGWTKRVRVIGTDVPLLLLMCFSKIQKIQSHWLHHVVPMLFFFLLLFKFLIWPHTSTAFAFCFERTKWKEKKNTIHIPWLSIRSFSYYVIRKLVSAMFNRVIKRTKLVGTHTHTQFLWHAIETEWVNQFRIERFSTRFSRFYQIVRHFTSQTICRSVDANQNKYG